MVKGVEAFVPGGVALSPARTSTETDPVQYPRVLGNSNPMHTEADCCVNSPIVQRIAHGKRRLSVVTGSSARIGQLEGTANAALGVDGWVFQAPIVLGDTAHLRITTVSSRASASKPDRGRGVPDRPPQPAR